MSSESDSENSPKISLDVKEKDDIYNSEDDSDYVPNDGEEDLDFGVDEETYQEFLLSLFPSKYLKNKVSNTKETKKKKTKAFKKLKKNVKNKNNKSQESDKGNKKKKTTGTKKEEKESS